MADCTADILLCGEPGAAAQHAFTVRRKGFRHGAEANTVAAVARDIGIAARTAHEPRVAEPGATAPNTCGTHRFAFATGRNPKLVSQWPGSEVSR